MRGSFVVIEGTDGSGKGTQFARAVERLRADGVRVETVDFPRYGEPSAYFVERYLNGGYGDVAPDVAALFYALDRFDAAPELRAWLDAGTHVLANRYTTSNLGHQAARAAPADRERVVEAIERLEYATLGLPRPDAVILLTVHPFVAQQLVARKGDRAYLKGATHDVHEQSLDHLERAAESYAWVAQRDGWTVIDCMRPRLGEKLRDPDVPPEEKVRSVDEIHELVMAALRNVTRIAG